MKYRSLLIATLVALAAIFCLAIPVGAGPLEDVGAAYEKKDYATALAPPTTVGKPG